MIDAQKIRDAAKWVRHYESAAIIQGQSARDAMREAADLLDALATEREQATCELKQPLFDVFEAFGRIAGPSPGRLAEIKRELEAIYESLKEQPEPLKIEFTDSNGEKYVGYVTRIDTPTADLLPVGTLVNCTQMPDTYIYRVAGYTPTNSYNLERVGGGTPITTMAEYVRPYIPPLLRKGKRCHETTGNWRMRDGKVEVEVGPDIYWMNENTRYWPLAECTWLVVDPKMEAK